MRRTRLFLTAVIGAVLIVCSVYQTRYPAQAQGLSSGTYTIPHTACGNAVSGSSTGTQGYTVAGASSTPVVQNQVSAAAGVTVTFICDISPVTRMSNALGVAITDVIFYFSNQSQLGVSAAVLASGTFNGSTVFGSISMPLPAAAETSSTVAPVRADTGTLTVIPAAGLVNTTSLTAGAFVTVQFIPQTPIVVADRTKYFLTVTFPAGGIANIVDSTGAVVHTQ